MTDTGILEGDSMAMQERAVRPYRRSAGLGILAAACLLAGTAGAQTARIEQIPTAAPPPDAPAIVRDFGVPAQLATGSRGDLPAQVGHVGDARAPLAQVSREARSSRASPQLTRGKRSAQAAMPLSSRAQSKPGAVVRVGGKDRCDTAAPARLPDCSRVIETRAGEFTRANPLTLSAEQRLLIDQRLRDLPATADGAVRRIGRNEVDADASNAQGIASLTLPTGSPAATTTGKDAAASSSLPGDAEILGVIQALVGGTPATVGRAR
jgi:hypothetical protein